ncbi:MAG: hypothetical protein K2I42_05350 [Anaeroplasmataceae bacterium]|nr:hypothetical protein [Anaeroplasmataceae bacterium]
MIYHDVYTSLKKVIKSFIKKGYFEEYTAVDLFYLEDENSKAVLVFNENLKFSSPGMQIFYNQKGLNYLNDVLSTQDGFSANYFFSDCIYITLVDKNMLDQESRLFLKNRNIRIADKNLLVYQFKEGYGVSFCSVEILCILEHYMEYIYSLIRNEKEDIDMAFEKYYICHAKFNTDEYTYEVQYPEYIDFSSFPGLKKVNEAFLDQYQDRPYVNDTCYLFHSYLPLEHVDREGLPSIFLVYYENLNQYYYQIFHCRPEKSHMMVFQFLEEQFDRYGMPTTLTTNHRKIYSYIKRTMVKLNIDIHFKREVEKVDDLFLEIFHNESFIKEEEKSEFDTNFVS